MAVVSTVLAQDLDVTGLTRMVVSKQGRRKFSTKEMLVVLCCLPALPILLLLLLWSASCQEKKLEETGFYNNVE